MTRQYAAFISYRHRPLDIAVAQRLHKRIERFRIPRDLRREEEKHPGSVFTAWEGQPVPNQLLVFRDREELPLSNDLTADIFEALDNTRCLIVVCTPDTPKSLWVRREISYFISKHGRSRIITVLAAGTPEESIPDVITREYAEDGVTVIKEYEPLVAFLPDTSQGKVLKNLDKELLRLCAAILGCPYDSLRQRHKRRKMQRIFAATAAAFVVALSFIGMLLNRNQEIAEQKRAVQLRESELLAADAEEALLAGDALRAMESAINALPQSVEDDRPYYAPAESILMESMDILGGAESPVLLKEMSLEQMTPISHFSLSGDGSLAATIDDYGVVHCFDTLSGEELWTDVLRSDSTGGSSKFVSLSNDNRFLFCHYYGLLECRDPKTGEIRWSRKMEYAFDEYFRYDHRRSRLALVRDCFRAEVSANCLELTILDAESGDILTELLLDQSGAASYNLVNTMSTTRLPENGVFSEDGRYFACAFSAEEEEKSLTSIASFVVDLETETVVLNHRQDMPDDKVYYATAMTLREDLLYLSLEPDDDTVAATVMKLNWRTGELLWSTTTPSELEDSTFSTAQTSTVLFWNTIAIAGRYEKLYAIDLETGAILNSIQLPGTLTYLYTVSSSYYAFALSDGTYGIGWYSSGSGFILSTDSFYQVYADVGPHTLLQPYGGGIVQLYTDGNYFELSVSNVEREGYLALVGSESENILTIKRPITVEKPVEQTFVSLPTQESSIYGSENTPTFCTDGSLILGPFSVRLTEDDPQCFYAVLDRQTHQVTKRIDVENSYSQEIHFLPDGSGYLRYAEDTTTLHRDGEEILLTQKADPDHPDNYSASNLIATDTVRTADGNLLTVHCDGDTMTLLVNGGETGEIPLPASRSFVPDPTQYRKRYLFAGQNSCVLTFVHDSYDNYPSETFALFCPDAGWTEVTEPFTLRNTNALAFARRQNTMALVSDDNQVRLLDLTTGAQTADFSLQLPASSVLHMDFILEDSLLLVKTRDAQVLVYDITTGEIIFHHKLGSTYSGRLYTYLDNANQRLYIIDSNYSSKPNTLCIDLRSWTTLGTGSRILCFDEASGELIHFDNRFDTQDSLSILRVPGTQELVRLGQQMLAAQ